MLDSVFEMLSGMPWWVYVFIALIVVGGIASQSGETTKKKRKRATWVYTSDQKVFGVPGKSLNYARNLNKRNAYAGKVGERKIAQKLDNLAEVYPNTYILHSVKLPGKVGDMDHVVIQGNTVILVDSKQWKQDSSYTILPENPGTVLRNGEEFEGGSINLEKQTSDWKAHLGKKAKALHSILVIASDNVTTEVTGDIPFVFTNYEALDAEFSALLASEAKPLSKDALQSYLDMVFGYEFILSERTFKAPGVYDKEGNRIEKGGKKQS